ncbi:MAG TPA: nucleoside-diphosphate sugar epimerase/dehydratase [Burkholderiales bacterium]|nr:nucleoside-diphosphate sugar epimerase/dehydratase [Burkholderiales bacterium]
MKFNWRMWLAFGHDVAACCIAWLISFWLRFNLDIPAPFGTLALHSLAWVVPLQAALFLMFGLYRGIWRFASLPDLKRILAAVVVAAIAIPAVFVMLQITVPRSVLIIDPLLLVLLMGGSRFAYRMWKEQGLAGISGQGEPVAVVGAGAAAVNLIKELARSTQWRVAAAFDDDKANTGRELHGVRVVGTIAELPAHCRRLGIRQAIIALPDAAHGVRRRAVQICRDAGLKVLTVPSYDDLVGGKVTVSQIRHVELDDLLGRDPVVLDTAGLDGWIHGRCIMVTGAGGSIGAELCRQIARFKPARLVLFEASEFALYKIEQEFRARCPELALAFMIGDVKDRERIAQVLRAHRPSAVFHAAAYKHVPLMEQENAWQAVQNNVLGTLVAAQAALAHGVEKFVFISTDKAINPTSVMGASKRLAEMVCQALQRPAAAGGTGFVMVRFGNVLGSTGSVIPKFREQIAAGGPVTVTHPEMRRYFMSIPEAAQLVLQAGLMGNGGEIFVLDMGEPVLIADLARDLIKLSGFSESEIRIVYTGLRPGEKLYEEPLAADENSLPTPHPKLRIARARQEDGAWLAQLGEWLAGAPRDDAEVRGALAHWVLEYRGNGRDA